MADITYTTELVVVTCWCGIAHAVPVELKEYQERQHRDGEEQTSIYCPLGHGHIHAGKGLAASLGDRLAQTTAVLDQRTAELAVTQRELARTAKRVANGVCPHCHRSFVQLARHMRSKHSDQP